MDPKDFPLALSYDDVLLVPQGSNISSRSLVELSTQLTPHLKLSLPLISANMDTVTGVDMAVALGKLGGIGILPRFNRSDEQADLVRQVISKKVKVGAAIGVRKGYFKRAQMLAAAGVSLIIIDVAHGHQSQVVDVIKEIKHKLPEIDLVAGNVATYQGAHDLFAAGCDCVKVGVGPGTACVTRITSGFGIPQITAVMEAARAAREFKKTLICDGGTKNSGDIVKGLAAGSHAVMIGSQFAGTDEAPGEIIIHEGIKYKRYNGSASLEEKTKHLGKPDLKLDSSYLDHVEGVSALVYYKGPVENEIRRWVAGIRSGFSYGGARNIAELHAKAKFVRISPLGMRESAAHDLVIT